VIAALLLAAVLATEAPAATPAKGTLTHYQIDAPEVRDPKRDVRVYTPPGYNDPALARRRYPVIYLLHGWPGSEGNWPNMGHAAETADSLIASGRIPPVCWCSRTGAARDSSGARSTSTPTTVSRRWRRS